MTLKITAAEFSACVVDKAAMPTDGKPIFALIGRSNVGKSSLINLLCNRREMAKTSSTPGKTLTLNYYLINESFYMVDLPGYGYAKANKVTRDRVQQMVDEFFTNAVTLAAILHIIDVRHPPSAMDLQMNAWIREQEFRYLPILTKSDKLGQSELVKNIKTITKKLEVPFALVFSAKSGHGKEDLLNAIGQILAGGEVNAGSGARGGPRHAADRQGGRPQGSDRDRGRGQHTGAGSGATAQGREGGGNRERGRGPRRPDNSSRPKPSGESRAAPQADSAQPQAVAAAVGPVSQSRPEATGEKREPREPRQERDAGGSRQRRDSRQQRPQGPRREPRPDHRTSQPAQQPQKSQQPQTPQQSAHPGRSNQPVPAQPGQPNQEPRDGLQQQNKEGNRRRRHHHRRKDSGPAQPA
ncbi:MAG: YihA family ribosome biogenesis GTP-binding protein [Candidatus Riflebacteria bacterium]|nr:YihA family ribosome biogenesis GTP-binding protein [Candidatus Riflebacteria bacterium]